MIDHLKAIRFIQLAAFFGFFIGMAYSMFIGWYSERMRRKHLDALTKPLIGVPYPLKKDGRG